MPRITKGNLDEVFTYHPPTPEQQNRYQMITKAAKEFAEVVLTACPGSREQSIALTHIQEARMMANAAIALEHLED